MEKVWQTKPLTQSLFSRSPVDIIVPFHGQIDKVARLVESILFLTRSNPYQICLVDDASSNKEFIVQAKKIPQVVTVRLDEQAGFAGALAAGYKATKQPWVMFVHSDCVVEEPLWMVNMGRSLVGMKDQKVGMVSARTDNPGSECVALKGKKGDITEDHILKDGFLPFYCVLMHRELFEHTGGFIRPYFPFGYEDEEFSHRLAHFGYQQAVCGSSRIRHEGGATVNPLLKAKPHLVSLVDRNREKCIADIRKLRT